jgi:hypothetical protein
MKTAGMHRPYAFLSYCWGTKNTLVTTEMNFAAMKANIAWAGLPQTYKNAIIVTSELNILFLWIDALCI